MDPQPFVYVSPALVGYLASMAIAWPALGPALRDIKTRGLGLVSASLGWTAVLFGFVAAFLASQHGSAPAAPLLILGAVGALQCIIQGFLIRAGLPAVLQDPSRFGKLLVRLVLPETLTLFAFIYAFLSLDLSSST